jgi:hypothetical protein
VFVFVVVLYKKIHAGWKTATKGTYFIVEGTYILVCSRVRVVEGTYILVCSRVRVQQ